MPRFLALTSKGLGSVLENELKGNQYKVLKSSQTRTLFECNWQRLYEAHLRLRTATRILMPVLDFTAYNNEELYHQIKKHDFTKYIQPHQSLKIVTSIHSTEGPFSNPMFVSQKIKDAIVDMFRDKYDRRPDVDKKADLQVWVRIKGPQVSVSIDLTGESLTKRGYRTFSGEAPLREHMAAGLLLLTQWNGNQSLLDPMCGSGTFLIEAALIALDKGPGLYRKDFGFLHHLNFQKEAWDKAKVDVENKIRNKMDINILGYDINPGMLDVARKNLQKAGLQDSINLQQRALKDLKNTENAKYIIVCNPPYGERLKGRDRLEELYGEMGKVLKQEFKGSELWVLSGNKDLTPYLRMKSDKSYSVDNNSIDCKWLKYSLF